MWKQQQKQLTAHERVTMHKIFGHTMNWLEKYIEVAKYYPDWEQRKQIFNNEITRTDVIDNPEKAEKAFSTTLFGLRQALEESPFPSLRDELKEEYYKWIASTGIEVDNCPERLKQILFGINEILEGRGEKIMEDVKNRKETTDVNAPDYAERLNSLFSSVQIPLLEGRKQEKELEGKRGSEVDVNKRFSKGSKDKGEQAFSRIAGSVANRHGDFHFWKQKGQQIRNPNYNPLSDDLSEEFFDVSQWEIKNVVGYDSNGRKYLDEVLVRKNAPLNLDETGYPLFNPKTMLQQMQFSEEVWMEIKKQIQEASQASPQTQIQQGNRRQGGGGGFGSTALWSSFAVISLIGLVFTR